MHIVDRGAGAPLVLIPGVQGRWEWMAPAVDALARSFRVIAFSLFDEQLRRGRLESPVGLDDFGRQIDAVLDERRIDRAAICGVSFGGRIALRFAARRPERTRALILVSTPGPGWRLARKHGAYARRPWLFAPLFFAGAARRLGDEIRAAIPDPLERRRFLWRHLTTIVRAPCLPSRMAARAILMAASDPTPDCRTVTAPTLVICGEPGLDHVVPVDGALEYARLIPAARTATLEGTGHLGCVTRPGAFAAAIEEFVARHAA